MNKFLIINNNTLCNFIDYNLANLNNNNIGSSQTPPEWLPAAIVAKFQEQAINSTLRNAACVLFSANPSVTLTDSTTIIKPSKALHIVWMLKHSNPLNLSSVPRDPMNLHSLATHTERDQGIIKIWIMKMSPFISILFKCQKIKQSLCQYIMMLKFQSIQGRGLI